MNAGRIGAVLLLLMAVLLTACTPPGLPDPIAPTGLSAVPASPPPAGTVVIGLDRGEGTVSGFNPYSIADFSPAAQATASLVLPSAFVIAADGTVTPDADVIDNAVVTSQDPFTVTYTLDRKASWSDGTPVTAEDFSYLRDQLAVQPGTIGPVGYQLISDIRSRDAGKTVEVQFSAQFPQWRTLFSPLLPSHLMKDFPGGWGNALNADIPLSANRYKMTSYDAVTGQVTLARNDKYWGTPPNPAAVILRLGDPAGLLDAYSRGDVQALWFAPDAQTAAALADSVPADRRAVVPTPASVQLVFNTTAGVTALPAVRTAVAAGIDPAAVAAALTDGWADGATAIRSQVLLPSESVSGQLDSSASASATDSSPIDSSSTDSSPADRSPTDTTPAATSADEQSPGGANDRAAATAALAAAGFSTGGQYAARNGEILTMTLGYASGNPRMAAAARAIQTQLGLVGIEIDLLPDASQDLIEARMATGTMDLALITMPRGIADAVAAASAFGCPATGQGIGSTPTTGPTSTTTDSTDSDSTEFDSAGSDSAGSGPPRTEPTDPAPAPETGRDSQPAGETAQPDTEDASTPRTGNLSGYCEPATQRLLVAAVTGDSPASAADPLLWADLPVLPLIQESSVFAVSESLRSVLDGPHQGWMWTGPLAELSSWPVN